MQLMTKALASKMPKLYKQDGMGDSAMVLLHYFMGSSDWFVTEFDGIDTIFGYACIGGDIDNAELGYASLKELASVKGSISVNGKIYQDVLSVERDLHWTPKTLGECKAKLNVTHSRSYKAHEGSSDSDMGTIAAGSKRETFKAAMGRSSFNELDHKIKADTGDRLVQAWAQQEATGETSEEWCDRRDRRKNRTSSHADSLLQSIARETLGYDSLDPMNADNLPAEHGNIPAPLDALQGASASPGIRLDVAIVAPGKGAPMGLSDCIEF